MNSIDESSRSIPRSNPLWKSSAALGIAALAKKLTKATHVVTKGETLTSIAKRYHVSVDMLVQANRISKQAPLQVGQRLVIPSTR